ncbi:MAG: chromate resistance protein [Planctomycetes bacterium]|nr:chromate resistance protein [Planctomycetota bacterium]
MPAKRSSLRGGWLVLWHSLPPRPAYARVRIARRLSALGALLLKNAVYALPANPGTLEDLHWLRKEILAAGGEATVAECRFLEGLTNTEATRAYNRARTAAYAAIESSAARALANLKKGRRPTRLPLTRLRQTLAEAVALDHLGAQGCAAAQERIAALESALNSEAPSPDPGGPRCDPARYRGRTWVTRAGVYVDRIASAWLIVRYIDQTARFRFVPDGKKPRAKETGFDMFEAEFTHEGDACTFEVLLARFGLADAALTHISEIIHDIDIKDGKYSRPETTGVAAAFSGLAARHGNDPARLRAGFALLDDLYLALKGAV